MCVYEIDIYRVLTLYKLPLFEHVPITVIDALLLQDYIT